MKTIANSQFFRIVFEQWKTVFEQVHADQPPLKAVVMQSLPEQFYRVSLEAGACKLEGGSASAVLQGMGMLDTALKSGHMGDYLGDREARFPCRWIDLKGDCVEDVLCQRLLQAGYNGVILNAAPKQPQMFLELGIQILLKPQTPDMPPFDPEWKPSFENLEAVHAVYWKGAYARPDYLQHPAARDALQIDLALGEIRALEKAIDGRCGLIYELDPAGTVYWIPELMDAVGEGTMISFSALNGKPTEDHRDVHPLWELLRELPDTSATRLMPILNAGGVEQGEGVWPIIPLGLLEYALDHMRRQPFAGAVVLTRHLSQPGTFLDGALWTTGQALWGGHSPRLLLETWCKAYHPSLSALELLTDLWKIGRRLSGLKEVRACSTEECRMISESLLGELNRLQGEVDLCKDHRSPSIKDYFTYFSRDARRKVLHFLQTHHAPMVNVLNGDDFLESFWTVIQQKGRSGLTSGAKAAILETPQKGEEGSVMRQIYDEVVCCNSTFWHK